MALAAERVLGRRITAGLINVKDGHLAKLRRIELNECGHPVPDERGVAGSRTHRRDRRAARARTTWCSASSPAAPPPCCPCPPRPLRSKKSRPPPGCCWPAAPPSTKSTPSASTSRASRAANWRAWPRPPRVESLLLSDVIGDNLDVIGSGPTAPDASTFADASGHSRSVRHPRPRAGLRPRPYRAGRARRDPRNPQAGRPAFRPRAQHRCRAAIALALDAAAAPPAQLGFRTLILSSTIQGETREIARMHAAIAREIAAARPARQAAGLHHHRRRNHRHDQGRWARRPQPGIRPGRGA